MDIENALDNVNWTVMFNMMKKVGIKYTDRRLLNNLYKDELGVMRIQNYVKEAKNKYRSSTRLYAICNHIQVIYSRSNK